MEDNELVYLYNCNNPQVKDVLFKKYFNYCLNVSHKTVIQKFYNLPIEREDLYSLCYICFDRVLKNYNCNQRKYTFSQILINSIKQETLRFCHHHLNQGHYILNHAHEQEFEFACGKLDLVTEEYHQVIDNEEKMEAVFSTIRESNDVTKNIITLKAKGYSNTEIALELNITKKSVINRVHFLKKTIQNNMKN